MNSSRQKLQIRSKVSRLSLSMSFYSGQNILSPKKSNSVENVTNNNSKNGNKTYTVEDLYKIVQVQQNTINKLTQELAKKSHAVSRENYEKTLNELETEKYEHAKTKLDLLEAREKVKAQTSEIEFFKNELEKERSAYANVFELLKEKAVNEGTKSIDLISKIAETEIRYSDALQDMNEKEKKYTELCNKIREKEQTYEHKVQEFNLKIEQDKYIQKLLTADKTSLNSSSNNLGSTSLKSKKKV